MHRGEIIDLDECVINALELFKRESLPVLDFIEFKRPLVVGSGNAAVTGKIIFDDKDAVFADESDYLHKLDFIKGIDGAVIISASGGKHSPIIAKELKKRGIKRTLFTNNKKAIASKYCDEVFVFPKNSEPYTYNTSTYLGMILAKTREDPAEIIEHIKKIDMKLPKDFGKYDSFYFMVPSEFHLVRDMFLTKFDELFGPTVSARVHTNEQTKHAETITNSKTELFISIGVKNEYYGINRLSLELNKGANYGSLILLGYYIIGKIQKANEPYFKENIGKYVKLASKIFGERIKVFD